MHHSIDLPDWATTRGAALNRFDYICPARTALVIVDMQRVFLDPEEAFGNPFALAIIPAVNRLAAAMRSAGARVIWTRQTVSDSGPRAMPVWQYDLSDPRIRHAVETMFDGSPAHGLHPDMAVDPTDLIINKYRYSAFMCPDGALKRTLETHAIEMLVIVGTLTNVCCESTARDGNMLGYKTIIVSDATAAVTDAEQSAALLNLRLNFADVHSTDQILSLLERRLS